MPLSVLTFDLVTDPESWTIQGPASSSRPVSNPLADERFRTHVADLREWSSRPAPLDRPDPFGTETYVRELARSVSQGLTELLLAESDRRAVTAALAEDGRVRLLLRVRSRSEEWDLTADAALALPWELLAPEEAGIYPVREGRLAVIREALTEQSPELPEPTGPLTLAVTIAAPEGRTAIPYEQESFRLLAALAPLGQRAVFSNLGELDDLTGLVADVQATAIHFRGHGLPGGLLFEDGLGFPVEVPVPELRRRLATVLLDPQRAGSFPGLIFLAAPFTAREADEASSAAALHRSGFAQVIGFFGPVNLELNTRLEERFYRALAAGRSALVATEEARPALFEPIDEGNGRVLYPFGWCQLAVYHRGPDRPLAQPGESKETFRFQRRMIEVSGLPVLEHGFIGHRALQHEVRRKVERDGERLIVIQGLGGLGKTALASQLLVRAFAPEPADRLVLRCRELAEAGGDPILELRAQAEQHGRLHGLPFWDERIKDLRGRVPASIAGLAAVLRALRENRPDLVIYIDNAETLQSGPATEDPAALGSWLPGMEAWWAEMERLAEQDGCLVLATTRYAWKGLPPRAHLGMPTMSPADSLRLIDSFEALQDLPRDVRVRLALRVDGHPRTVELLDRLIARRREELGEISDPWQDLIVPVLPEQEEKIRTDLLIEKLWEKLSEPGREHARVLTVLRRPAPRFVIDRLGKARDELIRTGWLTRYREQIQEDSGVGWYERWGLQVLARDFVVAGRTGDSLAAHRAAADAWEAWLGQPGSHHEDQGEAIHHLFALGEGDRAWPIVEDHTLWLRRSGRFQEAEKILTRCEEAGTRGDHLAIALAFRVQMRTTQGDRTVSLIKELDRALALAVAERTIGTILHEQAGFLVDLGQFAEAESRLRRALEIKERVWGTESASYAETLQMLATSLVKQGKYQEAEKLMRRVLATKREELGIGHQGYADALRILGDILESQGKIAEAESLLRQAVSRYESILGPGHPFLGQALHSLALLLDSQNKFLEGEGVARKALSIFENAFGSGHPYALSCRVALGNILESLGRYQEAETELRRAVKAGEAALGPTNPNRVESLQSLAFILWRQGKLADADGFLAQAAAILDSYASADHPLRGIVLALQAQVCESRNLYKESETLIQRALEIERASLGQDHPTYAVSLRIRAGLVGLRGQRFHAEGLFRHALAITIRTRGVRHHSCGHAVLGLAWILEELGHYDQAEPLFRQGISIYENAFGKYHPLLSTALVNLSALLAELGRGEEAQPLLERALQIARTTFGDHSAEVAGVLNIRAQVWQLIGNPDCVTAAEEALALYAQVFGPDHPKTQDVAPRLHFVIGKGPSRNVPLTRLILAARTLERRGDMLEATRAQEEVVRRARERSTDPDDLEALRVEIFNVAAYYRRSGFLQESVRAFEEVVEMDSRSDHPDLASDLEALEGTRELARLSREEWEAQQAEMYIPEKAEETRDATVSARNGDIDPTDLFPRARETADRFVRRWPSSRLAADFQIFIGALEALVRGEAPAAIPESFSDLWKAVDSPVPRENT